MNLYEKLQQMRVDLQQKNIKKSGRNTYSGYDYYELADILPPINELQNQYKTCSCIRFNKEEAVLTIINSEKMDEKVEFTSPMAELSLRAANPIQNLGGVETYQRRYLYMTAFEIVENDYFDSTQGKEQAMKQQGQKALTIDTSEEINRRITSYSKLAKKPISEIKAELSRVVGKELKSISETEGKMIVSYLGGKINKEKEGVMQP